MLIIGGLGIFALYLRNRLPWLPIAAILADGGIVIVFYKLTLETIKTANELTKARLENEKLRLEVLEKESSAKARDARIVIPTADEVDRYSRKWAVRGSSLLALILLVSVSYFSVDNQAVRSPAPPARPPSTDGQPNRKQYSPGAPKSVGFHSICSNGDRLEIAIRHYNPGAPYTSVEFEYTTVTPLKSERVIIHWLGPDTVLFADRQLDDRGRFDHYSGRGDVPHFYLGEAIGEAIIEDSNGAILTKCSVFRIDWVNP
jgi:hypothetical protein